MAFLPNPFARGRRAVSHKFYSDIQATRHFLEESRVDYNDGYKVTTCGRSNCYGAALSFKIYYFGVAHDDDKDKVVILVKAGVTTIKRTDLPYDKFADADGNFSRDIFLKEMYDALRCGKEVEKLLLDSIALSMARAIRTKFANDEDETKKLAKQLLGAGAQ